MTLPTYEQIVNLLAAVTLAMPVILAVAHGLVTVAERLYAYALTTPGKDDDRALARILGAARWLDQVARALAHLASLGVLRRPRIDGRGGES